MSIAEKLLTAEEFFRQPPQVPAELIGGSIVEMNLTDPRHGEICAELGHLLRTFLKGKKLGRIFTNDTGFITRRNPDSVRGPDVAYLSFVRLPAGTLPRGYLEVIPELVFEVRSPSDRWADIVQKAGEFLQAGAELVCVVDPETASVQVFRQNAPVATLAAADEFTAPEVLPGFGFPVQSLFSIE